MQTQDAADLMWEQAQQGVFYPSALENQLSLEEAYRIQKILLQRHLQNGQLQTGWKIGLTADAVRAVFKSDTAVYGYLLAQRRFSSGKAFTFSEAMTPSIESELCFTLKDDLKGPGITPEQVQGALASIAPAFEIIERRGDMAGQLPLGVADNVSQWAYVIGKETTPYPASLNLGDVRALVRKNGETVADNLGREVIDQQLGSIAWLANLLADVGAGLSAGQIVMSGSFTAPLPITQGDVWETEFSGVGTVKASFL